MRLLCRSTSDKATAYRVTRPQRLCLTTFTGRHRVPYQPVFFSVSCRFSFYENCSEAISAPTSFQAASCAPEARSDGCMHAASTGGFVRISSSPACAAFTAIPLTRSPEITIASVRKSMVMSSQRDAFVIYQMSSAALSSGEISRPPLTCAQPVSPGRTSSRNICL